jgi:geranylgeranyl pyrophosphate synthase
LLKGLNMGFNKGFNAYALPGFDRVEKLIEAVMEAGDESTRMMLGNILPGGKRLRPALVLLAASFYPHDEREAALAAAASELIHTASLVHDDVIDMAGTRRGRETINMAWGNHAAVLLGDFLFAEAFRLLADCRSTIMKLMTRTIQVMSEGELEQLNQSWNPEMTEAEYFSRIGKKTASLIAASCQIGGLVAEMDEEKIAALREYGLGLGTAFQIVDDLLDYASTEADAGKPVGHDLKNGTLTLPLLHLLRCSEQPGEDWQTLTEGAGTAGKYLPELLAGSGSLAYSLGQAVAKVNHACRYLSLLPAGSSRELLRDIALQVLDRPELKNLGPPQEAADPIQPPGTPSPVPQDGVAQGDESLLLHLGV